MSDKTRHVEWGKIAEYLVVFAVLPILLFWYAGSRVPWLLSGIYYICVTSFIVQAAMSYFSSWVGMKRRPFKKPGRKNLEDLPPIPKTTFIVSAFLPNEIEIIEDTLLNLLNNVARPDNGLEVILAYNTPKTLPIEKRLRQLALERPELVLANAHGSRSKAENLNYVLSLASGSMIGLLDADHIMSADCLPRAWRWLAEDYDVVQGRCLIRNGQNGIVPALVSVEFEGIYGVQHQSKSIAFKTALFGGSAGFWNAEVLRTYGFAEGMLTEDIDLTLRALVDGVKFVHDRSIVSTELAPETVADLWYQRKRWSQGWFECSFLHQVPVLATKHLDAPAKFIWTWLLVWRVTYDFLSNLLFPVLIAYWLNRARVVLPLNPYIWFGICFTMLSGPFEAVAAYAAAAKPRFPLYRLFLYAFMAFPYTLFKNMIQMIAIRDHMFKRREWIVTAHHAAGKDANK